MKTIGRIATAVAICAAAFQSAVAQETGGTVTGTVLAAGSFRPLSSARVTIADQEGRVALTDASGRFRITNVTGTSVVVVARHIGYTAAQQTVRVGSDDIRITLTERPVELEQMVVTGTAGGEQRRTIGNSVVSLNAADVVAKAPITSMQDLINGRAPGVVVMPGTGMIGSGSRIRIRGMSTFSLSGDPLIYVDGVRVNNETGTGASVQAFSSGVISRLNDFDPSEIESIEVLKGPAAATLYGTEAARGVINIITKRGAVGGTQYSFTAKQGTNWFMNDAERIGANYWRNPTTDEIEGVNVIERERQRGTPVFRTGQIQDYSASVAGGAGTLRYFASGDLGTSEGAEPNNMRRQLSGRTNLSVTPSEKFDLQSSVGYIQSHTTLSCEAGCGGAMWGAMYSNPANLPENCAPSAPVSCQWVRGFQSSPPEVDRAMQDWQDINRFTGSITANIKPFNWLTSRVAVGTDFTQEKNEELLPYQTDEILRFFWGNFADGWKWQNRRDITYNTYDVNSTARFQVTPALTSATSAGVQYYSKHVSFITAEGDFFTAPGLETISAAAQKVVTLDDYTDNNTLGFYVQEQVGLNDRLFVTGAVRVDNNSAFGKDIKWVTYPKVSLSWVAHEEPFARDLLPDLVSSFKLRLAHGHSGQQPQAFTALRTLSPVAGPAGTGALTPQAVGNVNLKPERGVETEVGFDASFFGDRLGLDFTYYNTATKDAILSRGVAPSTGFGGSNQFVNAGEILNQGIEFLLKAQVINRSRLSWESTLNLSRNSGKVRKLFGGDTTIDLGSVSHRIGYAPWSYFERRVISADYDPVTERAINIICDDGRGGSMPCYTAGGLIQAPKVYLGRTVPAVEGAWMNTIRFLEHFRASSMVDFKAGYKRLDNNLRIRCQIFLTCLEVLNPATTDPARLAQMQSNGTLRDFVITNGRFAKLREIALAYDAPERYASRLGARSLMVSMAGRNLHTWTPYTGLDPESMFLSGSPNFVDQAELPQLASLVFTLQLTY